MTARGFVLPVVMMLLGLVSLLLGNAGLLGAQASALAARELLRLRVFEAAEAGALAGLDELRRQPLPRTRLAIERDDATLVSIGLVRDAIEAFPPGTSAARARLEHYRVTSVATGPRRGRLELETGVARWVRSGGQ